MTPPGARQLNMEKRWTRKKRARREAGDAEPKPALSGEVRLAAAPQEAPRPASAAPAASKQNAATATPAKAPETRPAGRLGAGRRKARQANAGTTRRGAAGRPARNTRRRTPPNSGRSARGLLPCTRSRHPRGTGPRDGSRNGPCADPGDRSQSASGPRPQHLGGSAHGGARRPPQSAGAPQGRGQTLRAVARPVAGAAHLCARSTGTAGCGGARDGTAARDARRGPGGPAIAPCRRSGRGCRVSRSMPRGSNATASSPPPAKTRRIPPLTCCAPSCCAPCARTAGPGLP